MDIEETHLTIVEASSDIYHSVAVVSRAGFEPATH